MSKLIRVTFRSFDRAKVDRVLDRINKLVPDTLPPGARVGRVIESQNKLKTDYQLYLILPEDVVVQLFKEPHG
jgi:hypothetical protein